MLRSISSNWALNALQILVFMVLTPFAANALGRDLYGVWEVLVATAGPLQLLALGLPMATVRAVSAGRSAEDDPDAASRAVGTSLSMTLVLGVVAASLGGALWFAFDALLVDSPEWSGLGESGATDARAALTVLLVNVAAGFALKLPYAVYDAHGGFVARNLIMGGGLLLKLGATVGLLTVYPDLFTLAWIQLGIAAFEFALALGVSRRRHPEVRFAPRRIRWREAKALLSFSVFAFLLNMGALLAFRLDALVIGAHMEPEAAAIYGFGNKIFDPFIQLILGIGMVLMPMAASHAASRDLSKVEDAFLKWSKIAATLVFLVGGYLMILGPAFLDAWLGDESTAESGRLLQVLMVSFFVFLPVRGVALPVLMGLGRAKGPGVGLLVMGLLNVGLSVSLIGPYGLLGVALGTAIPNVLFSVVFARAACRTLGISPARYGAYAFGRPLLAALVAAGLLLLAADRWTLEGFPRLIGAGLAYSAVFGAVAVAFVFRGDPRLDLNARLSSLRGRQP
ncbi:MAG: polysaccharide biosynthesis C-terminal domain-containing protein [Planctomycetota bacterium]|nr:polysaccharide biosynthesis C-terminal domain-containing protein [Planctomycetota bacterium]